MNGSSFVFKQGDNGELVMFRWGAKSNGDEVHHGGYGLFTMAKGPQAIIYGQKAGAYLGENFVIPNENTFDDRSTILCG